MVMRFDAWLAKVQKGTEYEKKLNCEYRTAGNAYRQAGGGRKRDAHIADY